MYANTSNGVVLLSLGFVLMARFPTSNAFNEDLLRPGNSGGRQFPYLQQVRGNLLEFLPTSVTLSSTPPSTPPSSPPSSPPSTPSSTTPSSPAFISPLPSSSPPPPPCPLTTAQCNVPDCAAIPGCQQCQAASSGNGIFCIQCCAGFALRQGGLFCDACSQVSNCRTCAPIAGANAAPFATCTVCCPGFTLNQVPPTSCTPNPP